MMKQHLLLAISACLLACAMAVPVRFGSGVNLAGLEFGSAIPGTAGTDFFIPTSAEVDYYWNLGLRHFRIPFMWERIQRSLGGALDGTYSGYVNTLANYIISKGGTVVLDPHNYARYNGAIVGASGSGVTAANLLDLWTRLAAIYGSHEQYVIFGLMNEPNSMSTATWWSVAQTVVTGLRNAGYKNTITVPGNGWTGAHSWAQNWYSSSDASPQSNAYYAARYVDSLNNTVFEVHQYFDTQGPYSGQVSSCVTGTTSATILADFVNFLATNYAYGYIGEFATSTDSSCTTLAQDAFAIFKNNPRIMGTSWWAGGPNWGSYMFLYETSNLQGQVTQMGWQQAQMIPYSRSESSTPTSGGTPPTTPPTSSGTPPTSSGATPSASGEPSEPSAPSAPTDAQTGPSGSASSLAALSATLLVAAAALLL